MSNRQKSYRLALAGIALVLISSIAFASPWTSAMNWLGLESAPAETAQTQEAPAMMAPGTCDTAGPIEVESSTGTAAGVPTAYATLGAAFVAINGGLIHTGVITIDVCGDTNELAVVATLLAGNDAATADYTSITMSPAGGAARTITGAPAGGNPLIDFSGADNVTINGLNTGGNSLTISNTTVSATSATSTLRFIGGASNNTITNSNIQGSGTMSVATNGATIFFSTDAVATTGNDNNTISNNNIGPAGANLPTKAILGNGSTTSTAIGNSGIIIDNNNIFDYFGVAVTSSGIATNGGCNTWTITNNRFYQTGIRTWTTGALHVGIDLRPSTATSGVQGMTVTGNTIGFASNTQTGTYTLTGAGTGAKFIGISITGITGGTVSNLSSNTIASISMTGVASSGTSTSSPFMAIFVSNGNVIANSNMIGSLSGTGSLSYSSSSASTSDVMGIFNFGVDSFTTNDNNIGGITAANTSTGASNIYGLRVNTGSGVTWTATGNTIGGSVANSISSTSTAASSSVQGILNNNPIGTFTSNTIRNLTAAGGTGTTTSASVAGMVMSHSASDTIGQNTIFNLSNSNTTAATVVTGIQMSSSGLANVIERNLIHSLTTATNSATAEVNGIRVGAGTSVYRNNMIAIGAGIANAIGGATANGISGISEPAAGTDSFFHNSVYIGGAPTAGTGSSWAFNSTQTTNLRSFRDNIFFNARNNSGATGKNYIVRVGGTAPNPAGLTINNNIYFANGSGAVFGFFNSLDVANLGAWKTAVGQDTGSLEANPQYNDPANAVPDLHLHATNPTPAEGIGADVGVVNDFDGQTRASLTPVDIGADAGNFVPLDLLAPIISYTPLMNTASTSNRILSVTITDGSGVATGGNAPRIYFNKNAGAYSSTACTLTSGTVNNGTWDCTIDYTPLGGVVITDVIRYFVVAQDINGNLAANPSGGFTGTNVNTVTTPPTTPNQYTIVGGIGGAFNVGAGEAFTSLTNVGGIFEAINNAAVTSNITINITSDMSPTSGTLVGETGAVALLQYATPFTVTIQSSGGARVIEGAAAGGLIRFDGADNVTINGNSQLLFRNLSSAPALSFTNDATTNSIQFTTFETGNTSTTSGTVLFSTSTGTLGNSSNTLNGCQIRDRSDAAGVQANGVYSSGSGGAPNGGNFVSGSSVFNFTNIAVLVSATGAGNGWTVNSNHIYQASARTTATEGIAILGGSGHQITNNSIGGSTILAGGTHYATSSTFRGIDLSVGTASPTFLGNNTIKNIRSTLAGSFTSSYGIFVQAGRVDIGNPGNTSDGNFIGSANAAERYEISGDSYAIRAISTSTVNIRNNTINNFGTAPGVPTGEFYFGISAEGAGGIHSIINNTVTNVTNGSTPDASFNTQTIGVVTTATGVQTIRGNTISNVGSTSAAVVATLNNRIWGMVVSASATGTVVERNNIQGIYGSSPTTGARADVVTALQVQGTNTSATVTNNFISVDGGTAGSSDRSIFGILELASGTGSSTYQFNSVNVFGTSTGANNSYAYNRNSTQTVTLRNNIFADTRTAGTGFHVAMANTNAAATGWSATASNNNLLWNVDPAHVAQWLGGAAGNNRTLATFQTDSGGDAATTRQDPVFVSNTDLHIQNTSPAIGAGVTFGGVTTDYDNDPRPATSPDIGADEIVQSDAGTFPAGTFYNARLTPANYAGNVTITNTLYLSGAANIGANTVTVGCNATIVGASASNFIIGNLQRDFCALGVYDFPVGSAGNGSAFTDGAVPEGFTAEYSPMTATLNAGTSFPSSLTVGVVDTWLPQLGQTSSISRYWNVTEGGTVNADMLFQYLPEDVYGNEPLYQVFKWDGTNTTPQPGSVDAGNNQFTATGVTSFSGWAAGVINVTSANASISGRVTTANGAGIRNSTMILTGNSLPAPLVVQTGAFGTYSFDNLRVGETYVLQVGAKRFRFSNPSRVITLQDSISDMDFIANPQD